MPTGSAGSVGKHGVGHMRATASAGARFVCPCCPSLLLALLLLQTAALHPTWSSHSCSWTLCPRSRSNTACEPRAAKLCVHKSGSRAA